MESYHIKEGYKCIMVKNGRPLPYGDNLVDSSSYQIDVYKYASQLIKSAHVRNSFDIGCGYAHKLVNYIYPICSDITAVD